MELEAKYSKLQQENQQLKIDYNILKLSYDKLDSTHKRDKRLIKSLQKELEKYKTITKKSI